MFRNCSTWEVQWFPAVQPSSAGTTALACAGVQYSSHFNKKSEEFDQNHSEFRICEFLSRHLWHLWHLAVPGSSQRMWSIGKTWQHYDHDHCNSWPNRDLVAQWCLTLQNTITTKPYRKLVTPCNTSVTPNNIQQLFKSTMFVYSCGPVLLWERPHRMFFLGCFFCPAWLKRSNCLPGKAEKTGQPGFEGARKWMQTMGCKTPLFLQVVGKHIRSVWRVKNSVLCALQPVAPSIQFPGKRGRKPIQLRGCHSNSHARYRNCPWRINLPRNNLFLPTAPKNPRTAVVAITPNQVDCCLLKLKINNLKFETPFLLCVQQTDIQRLSMSQSPDVLGSVSCMPQWMSRRLVFFKEVSFALRSRLAHPWLHSALKA